MPAPRRSIFGTRHAASTRRRWPSSAASMANRNTPSMTRAPRPATGATDAARSRSTGSMAMREDVDGSTTVSFDPNCRPRLVKDKARYIERMDAFAAAADIVRMSDVDFEFLYGGSDFAGKAHSLIEAGADPGGGPPGGKGGPGRGQGGGAGGGGGA